MLLGSGTINASNLWQFWSTYCFLISFRLGKIGAIICSHFLYAFLENWLEFNSFPEGKMIEQSLFIDFLEVRKNVYCLNENQYSEPEINFPNMTTIAY